MPNQPSLVTAALRRPLVILWSALLVGCLGYLIVGAQQPVYSARAVVILGVDRPFDGLGQGSSLGDPSNWAVYQAGIMQSSVVESRARRLLGQDLAELVPTAVQIEPQPENNQIFVTAEAASPDAAKQVADAVSTAYREVSGAAVTQTADRALTGVTDPSLRAQIESRRATYGDGVSNLDAAELPTAPIRPKPLQAGIVGVVLGAAIGVLLALALERRARRRDAVGRPSVPWSPLLGVVPGGETLDTDSLPSVLHDVADEYRVLTVALDHLGRERGVLNSLLVSSVDGIAAGSVVGIAVAAQTSGRSVLVIDMDDVHGGLRALGAPQPMRTASLPTTSEEFAAMVYRWRVQSQTWLDVLGPPEPSVLNGGSFAALLDLASKEADLIIVLGGPVAGSAAAFAAAGDVDAVLLSMTAKCDPALIEVTADRLAIAKAWVLGYVVEGAPPTRRGRGVAVKRGRRVPSGDVQVPAGPRHSEMRQNPQDALAASRDK